MAIRIKRGTKWQNDTKLLDGQLGYHRDLKILKIGNSSEIWGNADLLFPRFALDETDKTIKFFGFSDKEYKIDNNVGWSSIINKPVATSSILGLVKVGYTLNDKNYPVQLNASGQMYVNVPWTDEKAAISEYTGSFGNRYIALSDSYSSDGTKLLCSRTLQFIETSTYSRLYLGSSGQKSGSFVLYNRSYKSILFRAPELSENTTNKSLYLTGTSSTGGVGSPTKPVYVTNEGEIVECDNSLISDTNTTYSLSRETGNIVLTDSNGEKSKVLSPNFVVTDITTGSSNGTISVSILDLIDGIENISDIAIKGLGTAAFKSLSYFATSTHSHVISDITDFPTVGNGTITITQNGTTKGTFTVNQSGNTTIALTDTDTNTTYTQATSSVLGLVKIGFTASGKNYPVQLNDSGQMYVNVPWTDTTGTWQANTKDSDGYVTKGSGQVNKVWKTDADGNPAWRDDTDTWRGIQNNLTSTSTADSLSANQGRLLANGSARDSTKLPLAGGTMTGSIITPRDDNMGIIPIENNWGQIGSSDKKFHRMYATKFVGNLEGNATSASKLTTNAGSTTNPVYFSDGKPVECTNFREWKCLDIQNPYEQTSISSIISGDYEELIIEIEISYNNEWVSYLFPIPLNQLKLFYSLSLDSVKRFISGYSLGNTYYGCCKIAVSANLFQLTYVWYSGQQLTNAGGRIYYR